MAEILELQTPAEASARQYVLEHLPDRPTREIIDDL